ncbi:MAG: hypothetical protein IKH01_06630 [Prevotella sp.]|nr:hypothetical protein [Prevotella sp.]
MNYSKVCDMVRAEAIDLGLSIKWASCNVGALSSGDKGGLYAWGETEEKEEYTLDNYKFRKSYCNQFLIKNEVCWDWLKDDIYCFHECVIDFDIMDDIAGTKFDVARVKWGTPWRMPRISELEELYENCSIKDDFVIAGELVMKITGRNGNSILLPYGKYWSSIESKEKTQAHCFEFDGIYNTSFSEDRECGLLIRPVFDIK